MELYRNDNTNYSGFGCLFGLVGTITGTIIWIIITIADKDNSHLAMRTMIDPVGGIPITGLVETAYPDWSSLFGLAIAGTILGYITAIPAEFFVRLIRGEVNFRIFLRIMLVLVLAFVVMMAIGILLTVLLPMFLGLGNV